MPTQDGERLVLLRFGSEGAYHIPLNALHILITCKIVELPEKARDFLASQAGPLQKHSIEFDYDYWTAGITYSRLQLLPRSDGPLDDILAAVLPEELVEGAPSGFATVGHMGKHITDALCVRYSQPSSSPQLKR